MYKVVDLHGYIHCMPYGNVEFVIKLSPLHPGYVMMVCAAASVDTAIVRNIEESILLDVCGCVWYDRVCGIHESSWCSCLSSDLLTRQHC